jgi:hypothetical protein
VTNTSEHRLATGVLVTGGSGLRATPEAALERWETRGSHNRFDYPQLDPALQVNLVGKLVEETRHDSSYFGIGPAGITPTSNVVCLN